MQKARKLATSLCSGIAVSAVAAGGSLSAANAASFDDDVTFLQKHTPVIVLQAPDGPAKAVLAPAWQGRVMTSTTGTNCSFGWINRDLIQSGVLQPHINVFGGEDRFWLGPEGGQYSIFFAKGTQFELKNWFTPASLDTLPFQVARQAKSTASFTARFSLTNYSGTVFDVGVEREVRVLGASDVWKKLGVAASGDVSAVAYETVNKLSNLGPEPWKKESGLLSIWILGMFNPSPSTTILVPIKKGSDKDLGPRVTSDYFGPVPAERLRVGEDAIFFSGDGLFRSKIGINPRRSLGVLGSYDKRAGVLTLIQFTQPEGVTDYVNSQWKLQEDPFAGDAANSYNDGVPSPGAKPLGPFYELESSSPAAALAPKQSLTHVHRTIHIQGSEAQLNRIAKAVLKISLSDLPSESR
jgi:hypothetical protein